MIDKDTLIRISKLHNLRPWQQEKHYIQNLVLIALSEYPLVFKGGTYLWFFHGLDRFSEDLDFTATAPLPEDLATKVSETLSLFGVENKVKIVSQDERSLSFRISAKGPLNTADIDVCHVYIEISRREKIVKHPLPLQLNFDAYKLPTKLINGMSLDEVGAEKVRAIMTRDKARDVYDLFFLVNKKDIKFDGKMTNEKLKYYAIGFSSELFEKKLEEKKKYWAKELTPWILGELVDFQIASKRLKKWIKDQ